MTATKDKVIARNTVFLYMRMILTLGIQLYTSRVVLDVLGVDDYGIYNVVGGLIVIMSFLNGAMSGATQRFLNFEMGLGEKGNLKLTFSSAMVIHLIIAGLLLLIGETVGLWFVNSYLNIDPSRMDAANWVYQFSLVSGVFTILTVPFNGAVFAHERMDAYAYITMIFTLLKLGIALLLIFVATADNLIVYAALVMLATIVQFLCFAIYSYINFSECRGRLTTSKTVAMNILKYSGSDIVGTTCYTVENQGVLVILNKFGGTALNAAAGLCVTVNVSLYQFGSSIVTAFIPQIVQQYAAKNYGRMNALMVNCSKFSILLFSLFSIPAFVEMDLVLDIWLKEVPPYTSLFCRLALLMSLSQVAVITIASGIHATGRILGFSVATGLFYLIELPIMYYLIKYTGNPAWAYIVSVIQMVGMVALEEFLLYRRMPEFAVARFAIDAYLKPVGLTLAVGAVTWVLASQMPEGFVRLALVCCFSSVVLISLAWKLILTAEMKKDVKELINKKFAFLHHKS